MARLRPWIYIRAWFKINHTLKHRIRTTQNDDNQKYSYRRIIRIFYFLIIFARDKLYYSDCEYFLQLIFNRKQKGREICPKCKKTARSYAGSPSLACPVWKVTSLWIVAFTLKNKTVNLEYLVLYLKFCWNKNIHWKTDSNLIWIL